MTEATQQRIANYHAILDVADTLIARWFNSAAASPDPVVTDTPSASPATNPVPPDPATLSTMVLTLRRVIDTRHRLDNWDKPPRTPKTRYPNGLDREMTEEEEIEENKRDAAEFLKLLEEDYLDEDGNEYGDEDEDDTEGDRAESQDDAENQTQAPIDLGPAPVPGTTAATPNHPQEPPIPQSAIQPTAQCQGPSPEFHSTATTPSTTSTSSTLPTPSTPTTAPAARPPPPIT